VPRGRSRSATCSISWILPFAVLLAVPLALLGTAGTLLGLHVANNLYTGGSASAPPRGRPP
jgi:hypothetical protein